MTKIREFLRRAARSRTMIFNVLLAILGGLELVGAHLTTLLGAQVAAAILLTGAIANMALRAITTQPLSNR
jgi:uncharacterized membrane protein YccF (DUF307 family)